MKVIWISDWSALSHSPVIAAFRDNITFVPSKFRRIIKLIDSHQNELSKSKAHYRKLSAVSEVSSMWTLAKGDHRIIYWFSLFFLTQMMMTMKKGNRGEFYFIETIKSNDDAKFSIKASVILSKTLFLPKNHLMYVFIVIRISS